MHDACSVRFSDAFARLKDEIDGVVDRQCSSGFEQRTEVGSVQKLKDQIGHSVRQFSDIEHLGDVLAAELYGGSRFAFETFEREWNRERARKHHFDGDTLAELQMRRRNHEAHTPRTKGFINAVLVRKNLTARNR